LREDVFKELKDICAECAYNITPISDRPCNKNGHLDRNFNNYYIDCYLRKTNDEVKSK